LISWQEQSAERSSSKKQKSSEIFAAGDFDFKVSICGISEISGREQFAVFTEKSGFYNTLSR
jgi:hypothetical protein